MKMTEYMEKTGMRDVPQMDTSNAADIFSGLQELPSAQLAIVIVFYLMAFIFSAVILGVLLYAFIKNTSKDVREIREDKSEVKAIHFISFLPGILVVIFIYVCNGLLMGGAVGAEEMRRFLNAIGIG